MILRCVRGPLEGREWEMRGGALTIGRDIGCEISLNDPKVSRVHAEIGLEYGRYVYRDRGSTNGSLINDAPADRRPLLGGDRIAVGATELMVVEKDEDAIKWDEDKPNVNVVLPMDEASQRITGDWSPEPKAKARKKVDNSATVAEAPAERSGRQHTDMDGKTAQRSLSNLKTLYRVNQALTQIMVPDDLNALIERTVFETMPDVERLCLLRRDESGEYRPVAVRSRGARNPERFAISTSVVRQAETERAGVLASDAVADERFAASDSVVRHQVRSVMCAPMPYRDSILGALYVDNRRKTACFDAIDLAFFSALSVQAGIAMQNAILYENVQKACHQAILALINTLEAKDPYTFGHTERCVRYAVAIGQEIGLSHTRLDRLKIAAQLHDIGKVGTDQNLIMKVGKLTDGERQTLQNHVHLGEKILQPMEILHDVIPIIRHHHERFDGCGYPDKLKGEQIPLESRIIALADAFDAMTTQRAYNKPNSYSEAVRICREDSGKHFDPAVVEALERFLRNSYARENAEALGPALAM